MGAHSGVALRIPLELRERLDRLAATNGRSLSEEIREALESHTKKVANREKRIDASRELK